MYTVTFLCTSLGNNLEISLLFLMFGWNRDRKHDYVNPVPAKLRHLAALRGKTLFRMLASSRFVSCKISVIWSHCKSSCSWHLCVGGGRKVLLRSASLSSFFVYMYSRCLHSWNPRCRGGRCHVRSENAQFGSLYTVLLITCGVVWLEEMSVAAASLVSTRCFSSILIKVMFSFFPHTMTVLWFLYR